MNLELTSFNEKLKWFSQKEMLEEIFKNQYDAFVKFTNPKTINKLKPNMKLSANTLIHGTSFDYDKLKSIKETGILSGDFIGIEEQHEETPFMADFFRIDKEVSLFQFYLKMNGTRNWYVTRFSPINDMGIKPSNVYIDVSNCRLPFLNSEKSYNNVAFILNGDNEILKAFQQYDYYRKLNTTIEKIGNRKNTSEFYPPEMSAIFLGVPSSLFSAIIVGSRVERNEEKMAFLKETFNDLVILSCSGKIIYVPEADKNYFNIDKIHKEFEDEMTNFCKTNNIEYAPNSNFANIVKNRKNSILYEQNNLEK